MSFISTAVMALSMSTDAFAVSIGKGVKMREPRLAEALKVGILFGSVEGLTPLLGWTAGRAASGFIFAYDHWVAFGILLLIGAKMIRESFSEPSEEEGDTKVSTSRKPWLLLLTAIGTSIDAMAVGITLAFLNINIWVVALAIGCATFVMVTLGMMTGHYIGTRVGRMAEAFGGVCLIAIGTKILLQHLGIVNFSF